MRRSVPVYERLALVKENKAAVPVGLLRIWRGVWRGEEKFCVSLIARLFEGWKPPLEKIFQNLISWRRALRDNATTVKLQETIFFSCSSSRGGIEASFFLGLQPKQKHCTFQPRAGYFYSKVMVVVVVTMLVAFSVPPWLPPLRRLLQRLPRQKSFHYYARLKQNLASHFFSLNCSPKPNKVCGYNSLTIQKKSSQSAAWFGSN